MKCHFCVGKPDFICLCNSKSAIICQKHFRRHENQNSAVAHEYQEIYYCPNNIDKYNIRTKLEKRLNILEAIKAKKIEEAYNEIEKISNELKKTVEPVESDIANLSYLLKLIFSGQKFSRIDNPDIVPLFNSSYEEVINILQNYRWLNFQNVIENNNPSYQCEETHANKWAQMPFDSSHSRLNAIDDTNYIPPITANQINEVIPPSLNFANEFPNLQYLNLDEVCLSSREVSTSPTIWSKLTEEGYFVPYSQADNDAIELAYKSKNPFARVGGPNSQCFVSLTLPILEIQEKKSLVIQVIRNNKIEKSSKIEQWYFNGDKGWEEMAHEASIITEWAYRNRYNEALVQGKNNISYKLDIPHMKQINAKTGHERDIRRGYEPRVIEETKEIQIMPKTPKAPQLSSRVFILSNKPKIESKNFINEDLTGKNSRRYIASSSNSSSFRSSSSDC